MVYPSLGRIASNAASVHGRFLVLISRSKVLVAVENKGVVIADGVGVGAGVESHRDLLVEVLEVVDVGARGVSSHV